MRKKCLSKKHQKDNCEAVNSDSWKITSRNTNDQ